MLFANASKIRRNWFSTLQPISFKLFTIYQSGHKKGHGCSMSTWRYIIYLLNTLIYALIYLCTCVKEKKTSLKFLYYFLYLKLKASIDFRQVWHVWREEYWVGGCVCNLSSFWRKLWEDSICEWPLSHLLNFGKNHLTLKEWRPNTLILYPLI